MWLIALFVCLGWVVSLCLHEFGHAIAAYWGGDTSVKEKGYLTLNPLKYTDPGLSLVMPLFFLILGGIALPGGAVYINDKRLRGRAWRSIVSAAGPLANIFLFLMLSIPFQLNGLQGVTNSASTDLSLAAIALISLQFVILLNIFVSLINLLPIPALDGYGIIEPWLPTTLQTTFNRFRRYGVWFLFGLLWFVRPVNQLLWSVTADIITLLNVPLAGLDLAETSLRQFSPLLIIGLLVAFWLSTDRKTKLYRQGTQLISAQKYEAAIAKFDQALQLKPEDVDVLHMKGYALDRLQHYSQAIALYDQALKLEPQHVPTLYDKASTLFGLGRYEEALHLYDQIIHLQPDSSGAWYNRGITLTRLQDYEAAIAAYDQVIQLNAEDTNAWMQRGAVLSQLDRPEEALAAYQRASKLKPTSDAWRYQIKLLEQLQRLEEAIAIYDQRLQIHPDDAELWYERGLLLEQLDRPEAAIASYQHGLDYCDWLTQKRPNDAQAWHDRGRFLEKLQRPEEALMAFQRAIELGGVPINI
jgi:tetratricopeptide (TPR) repeat protein